MAVLIGPGGTGNNGEQYLQHFAATTIQRYYRGYRCRNSYLKQKRAVKKIERAWVKARDEALTNDRAAFIIQNVWRGYRNKRIYEYYRDLIQFRERGDPRDLLRSINPREAQLADAAAGIHVRFRLGGTTFPPLVFYKIFTHRPVTDICSFCPRDYANEVRMAPGELHNKQASSSSSSGLGLSSSKSAPSIKLPKKAVLREDFEIEASLREYIRPDGSVGYRDTRGWYERAENNGWRPISDRILVDEDPVTTMSKLKRMPFFHYNPAQRRKAQALKAKERKRAWMVKLYQGLVPQDGSGQRPASAGDLHPDFDLDQLGDVDDAELSELLQWSEHLDFDAYMEDWTSMACSLGAEAFLPEDDAAYLAQLPGPGHGMAMGMAAAGVPMQPFKGGATAAAGVLGSINLL